MCVCVWCVVCVVCVLPHADRALLFVSLDSAAGEETSSKITGHMTGTKLSFNENASVKT